MIEAFYFNSYHNYPIHYAIRNGNKEIIRILVNLPNLDINVKNKIGEFPLMMAVKNKDFELVQFLCKSNPTINVNQFDNSNCTSLLYALQQNIFDIAYFLLSRSDINVNIPNNDKETALLISIEKNLMDIFMQVIYNPSIDPYYQDENGV